MNGVEEATGQRIGEYVILGGGSNSDLWCQIMADVLGAPVVRAHTVEATNLGAGILGAYGVGWYDSVEDAAAAMTDVAERFEPDERTAAQSTTGSSTRSTSRCSRRSSRRSTGSRGCRRGPRRDAGGAVSSRTRRDPRRRRDGLRARDPTRAAGWEVALWGTWLDDHLHRGRARAGEPHPRTDVLLAPGTALFDSDEPRRGARRRRPRGHRGRVGRRARGGAAGADGLVRNARRAAHEQGLLARRRRAASGCCPRRCATSPPSTGRELPPIVAVGGRARPTRSRPGAGRRRSSAVADRSRGRGGGRVDPHRRLPRRRRPTTSPGSRSAPR